MSACQIRAEVLARRLRAQEAQHRLDEHNRMYNLDDVDDINDTLFRGFGGKRTQ
jgi:hypothetical protein